MNPEEELFIPKEGYSSRRWRKKGDKIAAISIVYFLGLIVSMDESIILPSIWQYVQDHNEGQGTLGLVLMSFNISSMICSIPFGMFFMKVPTKALLFAGLLFLIIGNAVYGFAEEIWMIYFGRVLAGCGAGVTSAIFAYLATIAEDFEERGTIMVRYYLVAFFGMVIGPAIAYPLSMVTFKVSGYQIDGENAPAFITSAICIIYCFIVGFLFPEVRLADESQMDSFSNKKRGPDRLAYLMLVINFLLVLEISTFQTIVTPIAGENYGWDSTQNSALFFFIGITVIVTMFLMGVLEKFVAEKWLFLSGELLLLLGLVLAIIGRNVAMFISSAIFITFGYTMSASVLVPLFSKMVPPEMQGQMMGLYGTSTSFGQIVGPLWSGFILQEVSQTLPDYLLAGILLIVIASTLFVIYKFKPPVMPPSMQSVSS